eukprot:gene18964-22701_t
MASENKYDDEHFFRNFELFAHKTRLEGDDSIRKRQLQLLPDLKGANALDLGCGNGWFSKEAFKRGAASIVGFDISTRMIARANEVNADERASFRVGDLETIDLPDTPTYDLCHSTFAFHYIVAMERLFQRIHKSLKPGGVMVFSVMHPVASSSREHDFKYDDDGPYWRMENYFTEGTRLSTVIEAATVFIQHRTLETYINTIINTGFRLDKIVEWTPTDQEIKDHPEVAIERIRPRFLYVKATKNV